MTFSVIIPVYNEENSVGKLVSAVCIAPPAKEIIIVNDGSRDNTKNILKHIEENIGKQKSYPFVTNIKIVQKEKNEGKGAAIRTGIQLATCDIIAIQDADFELDPNEYPKLIEPFEKHQADIVFGSRFQMAGTRRVFHTPRYLANRFLTICSNFASGIYLTDMETCYKVFRREIIQSFKLRSNRFGIEPELTAYAARGNYRIYEVPVSYNPRTQAQGKKIKFKDGIIALFAIIRFNFFS